MSVSKTMKKWVLAEKPVEIQKLAEDLGTSEIVAQLLFNRGIKDSVSARKFFYSGKKDVHSPFLLPDIKEAVERVKKAIRDEENIILFGDYDVDGVASLAIVSDYFSNQNNEYHVLIPSRVYHGYGFNRKALDLAKKRNVSLIITLDCGTNSLLINEAKSLVIDVIVIDHHEVISQERNYLLVNPKRKDSKYPFREVSTGLLAFKFIWALKGQFPYEYLDLATLAIVCDVTPLINENRTLVKEGLSKIKKSSCLGLKALIQATGINMNYIKAFHIAWILGPRLNASGRISCAYPAWRLLFTKNEKRAKKLASFLDKINKERRQEGKKVLDSALDKLYSQADTDSDYVFVLSGEEWPVGILGIAASRIKERFFRPTFLISVNEKGARGSGRSVENFHLMDALDFCKDSLVGYGGHSQACGLEIEKNQIENFRKSLNAYAMKVLDKADLVPQVFIDKSIKFKDIKSDLLETLDLFSPYGEFNSEPLFLTSGLLVRNVTSDKWGNKIVWFVEETDGDDSITYPARIKSTHRFFEFLDYSSRFDIIYRLRQSNSSLSPCVLKITDVRIS